MSTWSGGDDPDDPDRGSGDFRDDVDPQDPPPVTDAMITPRTSPGGVPAADGGIQTCRVCGEANQPEASYCLACGVSLTATTDSSPTSTEPLPWVDNDDPVDLDFDDGLLDLGEMDEVAPRASEDGEEEEAPAVAPKITGRHVLIGLVTAAVLVLLYVTFRPAGEEETTPTTVAVAIDADAVSAYADDVDAVAATIAGLRTDAADINTAWDDRTEDYQATLASLSDLASRAAPLPDLLSGLTAPDVIGLASHQRLVTSANTVADAADEMVEGLEAPDTGEARRAALQKFDAAAAEFASLAVIVRQTADSVAEVGTTPTTG